MKKKKKKKPNVVLMVSYIPSTDVPTNLDNIYNIDETKIKKFVDNIYDDSTHVSVDMCVWTTKDGVISPCFVIPKFRQVANHLVKWAEDDPEGWFSLNIMELDDRYIIILMPNLKKSIARFKARYMLETGQRIEDDANIDIIFEPLFFISQNNEVFNQLKGKFGEYAYLILMDETFEEENTVTIGKFKINMDKDVPKIVQEWVKSQRPGDTPPFLSPL